jgi:ABC-2 type transport system permease protein
LLATPISVSELLAGKTLAGVIPAVIITWISYVLASLGLFIVARPEVADVTLGATWILAMLVLAPLLTITAVLVGVIISSRVNDVRLAEQLGGMLVLPLVALTIPVIMGKLLISAQMIGLIALGVAVLDAALLYVGIQLFQRETILIRWSK